MGEEKGKTLQAGWDLCWGSFLAASTPKAEPRPKAATSKKWIQGWPLRTCSAFSVPAWIRSQMPSAFLPFSSTSYPLIPGFFKSCSVMCDYKKRKPNKKGFLFVIVFHMFYENNFSSFSHRKNFTWISGCGSKRTSVDSTVTSSSFSMYNGPVFSSSVITRSGPYRRSFIQLSR